MIRCAVHVTRQQTLQCNQTLRLSYLNRFQGPADTQKASAQKEKCWMSASEINDRQTSKLLRSNKVKAAGNVRHLPPPPHQLLLTRMQNAHASFCLIQSPGFSS